MRIDIHATQKEYDIWLAFQQEHAEHPVDVMDQVNVFVLARVIYREYPEARGKLETVTGEAVEAAAKYGTFGGAENLARLLNESPRWASDLMGAIIASADGGSREV